jgi:hypothetical protein
MDETIEWTLRGWQALLLGALLLAVTGCGDSPTSAPIVIKAAPEPKKEPDTPSDRTAKGFIGQFLENLSNGETDPDLFTLGFKKKIARPKNEDDATLGYSKDKFDAFLRKIGRADKNADGDKIGGGGNQYEKRFVFVDAAEGPYALGEVKTKGGRTEGYLMHIIPAENPSGWQIDWFQHSPVFISYVADDLKPDAVGAELTIHRFIENLLGGDLLLAEATLSRAWKVKNYGSNNKPDADLGYNEPLVLQKLSEWKGDYPKYAITDREFAAGKPTVFEVIALDAQDKPLKILKLTVKKEPTGEWVVDDVEVK